MSRIVEVELKVEPDLFREIAIKKGYKETSENVFTKTELFRPIKIQDKKLKYDVMDVSKVTDLIADYLVEKTGGVKEEVGNEIIIRI